MRTVTPDRRLFIRARRPRRSTLARRDWRIIGEVRDSFGRAANLRTIVDDIQSQGTTSVRAIAAELNVRGILTPRGGSWHPTSAARLLARLAS